MSWAGRLFGRLRRLSYERSKELLAGGGVGDRRRVAGHRDSRPEVLYYLASDPDPTVRGLVAANASTPRQADALLADDGDEGVREGLARKIARLAPGLTADENDHLRQLTYRTLERLARDQARRVREVVASEIAALQDAPADLIRRLAEDPEIGVAGPILRLSPLLSDDDLLTMIERAGTPAAMKAIAQRARLAPELADRIATGGDAATIAALLDNGTAQIREATLDLLIEGARTETRWQKPLVRRPGLSAAALGKLAEFVAVELLHELRARTGIDAATSATLERRVQERLAAEGAPPPPDAGALLARALRLKKSGGLDADALIEMSERGEHGLAATAFAVLADVPPTLVERVIEAHSAKGVIALAWKAGLQPDTATRLQLRMLKLPSAAVLRGAGDAAWPLSPESMEWHLDFFRAEAR
jgi:uncharacterized protein (DUF2336 family)